MPPTISGGFSLEALKPSIAATNTLGAVRARGRSLSAADRASRRAHARYGICREWKYVVQTEADEPLHPFFLQCLGEERKAREALTEELKRDAMDAVTASDLIGSNLSVLLTTSGQAAPGADFAPENLTVDVYVTPRELRHHKAAFEEAVSILTQIFVQKMALPHCHELRSRGTKHGFMEEDATRRGQTVVSRNPWPSLPLPYASESPTTYQAVSGWPSKDIGPQVLPFLTAVFPSISPKSMELPYDDYHDLVDDDSEGPSIDDPECPWSMSESAATMYIARTTKAAAQNMCRAAARMHREVQALDYQLALKRSERDVCQMQAMQLSLRADDALADHLSHHGCEPLEVEQKLEEERALRSLLLSGSNTLPGSSTNTPSPPTSSAALDPAATSPGIMATEAPYPNTTVHKQPFVSPPATPCVHGVARPSPCTPPVARTVRRVASPTISPSSRTPQAQLSSTELSMAQSRAAHKISRMRTLLARCNASEGVADALHGVMHCHPISEWANVLEGRFEAETASALLDAMRQDWKVTVIDALDMALFPKKEENGMGRGVEVEDVEILS